MKRKTNMQIKPEETGTPKGEETFTSRFGVSSRCSVCALFDLLGMNEKKWCCRMKIDVLDFSRAATTRVLFRNVVK